MHTDCTSTHLAFEGLGRRAVVGRFDGGRLTTDGGVLLLREVDRRFRVTSRLAACFRDHRDPRRIEHRLETLVAQRVLALAAGYEDLNDHDRLRADSAFALASGCARRDRRGGGGRGTGGMRWRGRAREPPGARRTGGGGRGTATSGLPPTGPAIERLLVDLFLEAHAAPPAEIVLDLDATDDPLHGRQEGRFFHGYYGHYCYLPLYVTCGEHVLCARLRPADIDAAAGAVDELARIVPQIRRRWPGTRIRVRGDAGFCREDILRWCEDAGLEYVFGLARNARLEPWLAKALHKSRRRGAATGRAARRFRECRYRTLTSWSRARRVSARPSGCRGCAAPTRASWSPTSPPHPRGAGPLRGPVLRPGDMENRIREQQLWRFADRTSSATMRANQLRLTFSAFAGALFTLLRQVGLQGTAHGPRPRRHHPRPVAEGRRPHHRHRPPGLDRLPVGLPAAGTVRASCSPPCAPRRTRGARLTPPATVQPPPAARAATGATEAVCPAPAIQRDPRPESALPGSVAPDSGGPGPPGTPPTASKPPTPPTDALSRRRQVRW